MLTLESRASAISCPDSGAHFGRAGPRAASGLVVLVSLRSDGRGERCLRGEMAWGHGSGGGKRGGKGEGGEEGGVEEGGDVGDAGCADGENLDRVGVVLAVWAAAVAGQGGLAVGGYGDHPEVAGLAQDVRTQEQPDVLGAGEPGGQRRH